MSRIAIAALALMFLGAMPVEAPQPSSKSEQYIVVFYADWCGPCKRMKRDVWPNTKIKNLVKQYRGKRIYWVNVDKNKPKTRKYKVSSIPTVIIMDRQGKALKRGKGFMSVVQLEKFLTNHVTTVEHDQEEKVYTFGIYSVVKWLIIELAKLLLLLLG